MNVTGIVMAVGAPNLCRDGRKTMCSILLSEEIGFFRVYPIAACERFRVWSVISADIELHPKDNRAESYRLADYQINTIITDPCQKRAILDDCILKSGDKDPLDYQNERRKSIALIKTNWGDVECHLMQRAIDISASDEEFPGILAQSQAPNKPYLTWRSMQGKVHKTHLVGREVYEGLRKNPNSPWDIFNNMQVNNPAFDLWFLLGNMRDHRNIWLIPHVHRLKKGVSVPSLPLAEKRFDGWPYQSQEEENYTVRSKQLALF